MVLIAYIHNMPFQMYIQKYVILHFSAVIFVQKLVILSVRQSNILF